MNADPDPEGEPSCKPFRPDHDAASLWIGFLITLASLCYAALRSNMVTILGNNSVFASESENSDEKELRLLEKKEVTLEIKDEDVDGNERSNYEEEKSSNDLVHLGASIHSDIDMIDEKTERRTNVYFHVVMMLASAYMSMLFTNWGTNKENIQTTGTISFGVGVCCCWTVFIAYWWTICAPRYFPDRFEDRNDE